tara:strand:+ start:451 stop:879 length:429 start_codon:yes stop_codon:yes gene_type:complete
MSTIYKNFGIDYNTNKSNNSFKIVSKTGEELNLNPETLQLQDLNTKAGTKSINGYRIDQVFADFKNAGLTDKLANFYTITLQNIADKNEVDILTLYNKNDSNEVVISNSLLEEINNTLPNSVRFQNPVRLTSDKYVRLLIGA